ncbi:gag protein [Akanthomyces lecanii RCEF 1005]|uniref:Gag protein n=1 Tax=Akanthomyces lecanii RCEF 1005 TaxID=1081108 RepID=A0A168GLU2_CORDF|nr:gag protein [Akanthomyces lecanii RCEF 1005]
MSTTSGRTTNPRIEIQQLMAKIAELEKQNRSLLSRTNALYKTIEQYENQIAASGMPERAQANKPKFPKPEPFNGYKGDTLNTAEDRILCIGNLLTGKAMEWWEPTLRVYLKHGAEAGADVVYVFSDYETFEDRLLSAFRNPDEHKEAT